MLQIVNFSIEFLAVFGCLFLVGITRGRRVSQKTWSILWSIISLLLALFVVMSFILEEAVLLSYALGGSVGYIIAVTIHTTQHI
jgi:uncharacterized protein YebE (UPF0316 family)